MQKALNIANYFVQKSFESGISVTPMQLLKLTYIAHGWHLGIFGKDLITEPVQAWQYGPVINSVYQQFKVYKNNPVEELAFSGEETEASFYQINDSNLIPFLDKIWDSYGHFTGIKLSAMTHEEGTPWDIVWNRNGGKYSKNAIIPNHLIKEHYIQKINAARKSREVVEA